MSPKYKSETERDLFETREEFPALVAAMEREQIEVRERSPYGVGSEHSYFLDLAAREAKLIDPAGQERLNRSRAAEERAVTSGTLGGVVPGGSGLPTWSAETIATAARSAAPLAYALERIPLPPEGVTVPFGKFTSGVTGAVQNPENSAPSEGGGTSPAVSFDNEPFSTIETWIGVSLQAVERSGGVVDEQIAFDLGSAYGAKLESELRSGSGSSGRIRGLNNASWGTTKTLAAQTLADHLLKIGDSWQSVDMALGQPPDLIAMHPRRYAYLQALATNVDLEELMPGNLVPVASPGQVGNLGAGTNEDWLVLINRASTPLATDPPQVEAQPQQSGTGLQVNYIIHGYAAFATARRPEGLAVIKNATTPSF